jgi:tetratricopeptide (TPR) repeat protein
VTVHLIKSAIAASERGAWSEAEDLCVRALRLRPNDVQVLLLLGRAQAHSGNLSEAERTFEQARNVAPRDVMVLNSLGGIYGANGRWGEARLVLQEALAVDPNFPWAHQNLGGVLADLGDRAGARRHFEHALRGKPDYADAMAGLADLAEREHRLDEAESQAKRALQLAPRQATACLTLARVHLRRGKHQGVVDTLAAFARDPRERATHRAAAHNLMGQAQEKLGAFEQAYAAFAAANDIQRAIHAPRFAGDNGVMSLQAIARLTAFVKSSDTAAWSPAPPSERPDPVFFVGFPRSGTTLIEQVLASHPAVESIEEQEALVDAHGPLLLAENALARWKDLSAEEIAHYRAAYWRRTENSLGHAPERAVMLDKLPLNTALLPLVHRLFPDARILFALRDPRDVIVSCFQQHFAMNAAMFHFLSLAETVRYYDAVMELARATRERLPLRIHDIRYEDLVADFDRTVSSALEFLGLAWDEAVANHVETARRRAVRTPSAANVAEPIYTTAVGRWRRYESQLQPHLPALTRWARIYGYPA